MIKVKYKVLEKKSCPTCLPGATSLPPIGDSFMYNEASQKNSAMKTFWLLLNKQMFFKLVILLVISADFQFQLMTHQHRWLALECNF